MKPFIFILSMLMLCACNVRHRVKHTENIDVKVETSSKVEKTDKIFENQQEERQLSDSVKVNQLLQTAQIGEQYFQYFTLKNNGNCIENSTIRFVSITDSKGNKTEIPVNDNTELNFSHQNNIQVENKILKVENERLKKEKSEIENAVTTLQRELYIEQQKQEKTQKTSDLKVKSHRSLFWLFILIAVLAVIIWEIGKIQSKKLYNYVSIWKKKP